MMTSGLLSLQTTMGEYWDMMGHQVYWMFHQNYQSTAWLAWWSQGVEGAEREMEQKNVEMVR